METETISTLASIFFILAGVGFCGYAIYNIKRGKAYISGKSAPGSYSGDCAGGSYTRKDSPVMFYLIVMLQLFMGITLAGSSIFVITLRWWS